MVPARAIRRAGPERLTGILPDNARLPAGFRPARGDGTGTQAHGHPAAPALPGTAGREKRGGGARGGGQELTAGMTRLP